jgi:flagellar FliL protein
MADTEEPVEGAAEEAPKQKSKKGILIGLVLALVLGGGGFYAVYSGLLFGSASGSSHASASSGASDSLPSVAFVPLEPLIVSLGSGANSQHLRFRGELEVAPGAESDVTGLVPRVMDVLNSYLRAVSLADLEDPASLVMLRAQMLRRIQLVVGEGRVNDLLIMEFVLN